MQTKRVLVEVEIVMVLLSLLITCVYCRALGTNQSSWETGHKKDRISTDLPWEPTTRKSVHLQPTNVDECCPSFTEIIQPLGGVSKSGRILELYRDTNLTQGFYQTSCAKGVKDHPCRYMNHPTRSRCVQRYTYIYAVVRAYKSLEPWRMDHIRVRSGCSCEVTVFCGRRRRKDLV